MIRHRHGYVRNRSIDPLVLILRLTFLLLMASGFLFLAFTYVALAYVGMDQVWGLYGIGCALVVFVWAAMVGDALEATR